MPFVSGFRTWRSAAILLCALAPPALCSAAQDKDPDFSLADTVQAGPFHMAPFFTLKDLGYDGNTRLGSGESTSDYTVTLGPGARAVAPLGRLAAVSIWEQIDYSVFARQSDLNHVNNSLRSKVHVYLRDFTVYADGEQISSRDRPNNEIDYRIRTKATQGKLGFKWNPGTRGNADLFVRSTARDAARRGACSGPVAVPPHHLDLRAADPYASRHVRASAAAISFLFSAASSFFFSGTAGCFVTGRFVTAPARSGRADLPAGSGLPGDS